MLIEAEARLTLKTGEIRIVKFDLPLPYQTGVVSRMIEKAGLKLRDVRKVLILF